MPIKINGTNTAANPSITGDDTDTGIVYGTNQIEFSTGGTSKAAIDASGNLTLGGFSAPTDLNTAQVPTLFIDRIDNNIFGENNALYITQNAYFNNSGSYERVATHRPLQYKQRLGKHKFLVGDSGSAGGNVTFSEAVIIDADGLKFNGDTSSANALTDYEEGFWSPAGLDGMNLTIQNTSNNASRRYIKIGKQVHAYFDFTFQNLFNTFGARFGGLPYAQASSGHQASAAVAVGYTTKSADVYIHISGLYPTFFKNSGTAYNYNEVSSNRMAGVLIYTTD